MDSTEIIKILQKATNRYVCLQKEEYFLEYDEKSNYICINWHIYMDRFVKMKDVFKVAKYIRKYVPDVPIYSAFGLLKI